MALTAILFPARGSHTDGTNFPSSELERAVTRFVQTGPGGVLTGLVKRTLKDTEPVHA
jgi:hypothetical protein